jgi:hypothetical protein
MAVITYEDKHGEFLFYRWSDGCEQWKWGERSRFIAERVVAFNSRRKRWVIVDRGGRFEDEHADTKYPPKVAGPFLDADGAKVALKLLYSVR